MQKIEIPIESFARVAGLQSTNEGVGDSSALLKNSKRVGITTLGCKVNLYESELIAETLRTDQWQVVSSKEKADLYLINTCTVTREADRQARQEVRKAVKRNPDALVVVTGCYAQMDADACAAIPGVDLVLGNDRKLDVHNLLPQLEKGDLPKLMVGDLDEKISLPDQLLTGFDAHTRAFVQIQQGCDQGCTFCIIHVARGPSRSLPPSLIKRQVQRLVLNGYAEIVICGVDLGSYGQDFVNAEKPFTLVRLLEELLNIECDAENPFRIRLSSIDPHHISDELIALMAAESRICPHIHLSLQSGSTLILKRMKRRYDSNHVIERIDSLKSVVPHLVMSADVMVGFPTEEEVHYIETEKMVERLNIAFPHIFSYSERDGTPAARIPSQKQVPIEVRKQRNNRLRSLANNLKRELLEQQVGKTAWVLPEKQSDKNIESSSCFVARAEDYLSVLVKSDNFIKGKWLKVKYQGVDGGVLIGFPVA